MVTKKIILNELRSLVKQIIKEEIESSENKAINKIYSEYFIEKLDNALGKEKLFEEEEGEISEWFANLFWDYHYDDSVKKFINPNNNKLIDKIGKSYYGFSQFRTIGGIEIGYAKAQFDIDDNLYTDNLDEIINSIDILVNYVLNFKITSTKQIDIMIENNLDYPQYYIYKHLIPTKELKKYYLNKAFEAHVNFNTPGNSSFSRELLKFLSPEQIEKIRGNREFSDIYPEVF